ncbi:uncharacterized protein CIMG_02634 [Coccidioides immitis RS]|uniref:Protein kinase domain-containing protein n=1 Tax=Coccidioides immitis (strain RS) TaxID=246410 RepID=J3KLS5_COCIM|nr:uncharacterized protein CIMG_02634 [Coccidioides immitis RS]EAS37280.3 hypothetical protein CIMG_02634 [Coccidioides immitis RS]
MSSETLVVAVYQPGLLEVGWTGPTGVICMTNNSYIVKYPKASSGHNTYNKIHLEQMVTERQIYECLSRHEGVIPYHRPYDDDGVIRLTYTNQCDLEKYIPAHNMPSQSFCAAWVNTIYSTLDFSARNPECVDGKVNAGNIIFNWGL